MSIPHESEQPQTGRGMRAYAPRLVFAIGGLLAALSTVLPWIRFPFFGSMTLWGFRGIIGDLVGMTGESMGLAPTGLLLTALGTLILGLGTIAYAGVATSTNILRRGIVIAGGLTTVLGIAALVQAIVMTSDEGSISVGPIVLLVGGLVSLGSYFLLNSGTSTHRLPNAAQHVSFGAVGAGFLAAAVGVAFLFIADDTLDEDENDDPQSSEQQSGDEDEDEDMDEPEQSEPAQSEPEKVSFGETTEVELDEGTIEVTAEDPTDEENDGMEDDPGAGPYKSVTFTIKNTSDETADPAMDLIATGYMGDPKYEADTVAPMDVETDSLDEAPMLSAGETTEVFMGFQSQNDDDSHFRIHLSGAMSDQPDVVVS